MKFRSLGAVSLGSTCLGLGAELQGICSQARAASCILLPASAGLT